MPPKAKPSGAPSKKTVEKKKEKIIEDKTFGIKNKKGAKQQKFIQQVQVQVKSSGPPGARKAAEEPKKADKKDEKKKEQQELNLLFKPVTTQKVEKGIDPKSVLCAFFKQGNCGKGDRCKFSHDLTLERKAEKRSVYFDVRDDGEDNIENWDEAKLREVVEKKHAEADSQKPKTDIICKHFIDALEKNKYGWFWECPSREKCIYRHALPSGFVLNKDKKKDDKKDELSIEDLVERERAALGSELTKINLHTFMAWKRKKLTEKVANFSKEEARKKAEFKAGKSIGLSGREMFTFNPEMATQDMTDDGDVAYDTSALPRGDEDSDPVTFYELSLEGLAAAAREVDGSGTIATSKDRTGDTHQLTEEERMEGAVGGDGAAAVANGNAEDVPIDEDLFDDDDDLDMDELDEDLSDLSLQ